MTYNNDKIFSLMKRVNNSELVITEEQNDSIDIKEYCAKVFGDREVIFGNVLARVDEKFVDEIHLDTDEANASFVKNNQKVEVLKCLK